MPLAAMIDTEVELSGLSRNLPDTKPRTSKCRQRVLIVEDDDKLEMGPVCCLPLVDGGHHDGASGEKSESGKLNSTSTESSRSVPVRSRKDTPPQGHRLHRRGRFVKIEIITDDEDITTDPGNEEKQK
ncbi:hypothetical protein Pmar_PMAR015204 [Perkinsus marinus ATCC 50983]|uniref:Uncharacterized protein n=1 Tax=Perkinsus marinus (strain ATCC 50983 / TXsc) TaxID=423536 RepID=C5K5P8_PERM5|nr:hypothetical protein Pmar_PMAR015204 [Perkinsus marinus ATCC 50983]EER20205.1 hypothetical protein Pmar_PMAR015204 [Perkinsus marinus ATCC 50983]|eukprot:XP_002788409.1 hypothetical protein Pmar_PMAR015204 [Perkinsus marinus ATCC 50983]